MKYSLWFGVLVALVALASSACGGGAAGGSGHQQAKGRPLPKYEQASLPAGYYHTTEFEPSFSFRRSEEHTSELQSRQYLVCRLLLEKKTQKTFPLSSALSCSLLRVP